MEDTNSLIENRKAKLAELHERGVNPFSNEFEPTETCAEARGKFEEGRNVAVAGRITAHRDMGKSQFFDLRDSTGRIQIYAQKKVIGEDAFDVIKHLDLGDFLGVRGDLFQTRTGEITVKVQEFVVLSKALRPPPEKWHGLADTEIRYRQRYLDLIASEEVKKVFFKRSRIIWEIRRFLQDRGFIEVETPMMQAIPGGAAAQPFVTHHNSLGCDFYLRIALELYLKRLLVGGMDRVFEIGRNFRNEGISRRHNPEFTMLEVYQAYGNFKTMMELVESMVCHVAHEVNGRMELKATNSTNPENERIDLSPPWRKVVYKDLVKETAGDDWFELGFQGRKARAEDLGVEIGIGFEDFEITNAVFEKLIEPKLIQPTFVTHLLKELVPLAKLSSDDPDTVEVFELCINGQEIAPAYSEQNDPVVQRERLEHQAGGEQQKLDEDFLISLEHGMPPAGGMGIGIDRLCMTLLEQDSIRDVILFPQLRPRTSQ